MQHKRQINILLPSIITARKKNTMLLSVQLLSELFILHKFAQLINKQKLELIATVPPLLSTTWQRNCTVNFIRTSSPTNTF